MAVTACWWLLLAVASVCCEVAWPSDLAWLASPGMASRTYNQPLYCIGLDLQASLILFNHRDTRQLWAMGTA